MGGAAQRARARTGAGHGRRRRYLQLEAARAWVNEQLYLAYLSVFSGAATTQDAERHLTALAEAALTLVAEMVTGEMGLDHFPLCVLGLGKLGMNAMAPHSDLDLIFVVEEGWSLELQTPSLPASILPLTPRCGRACVGTRYPAAPVGAFRAANDFAGLVESHHLQGAKTWEHLAQVPMRPLSGSPALQDRVRGVRDAILRRPRDPDQLTADAYRMLLRLRDQRIYDRPDEQGEVKLRPGGLMELEYLLAVLTLRHGARLAKDHGPAHDDLIALWASEDASLQPLVADLRRLRDWFFAGRLLGPHSVRAAGRDAGRNQRPDRTRADAGAGPYRRPGAGAGLRLGRVSGAAGEGRTTCQIRPAPHSVV